MTKWTKSAETKLYRPNLEEVLLPNNKNLEDEFEGELKTNKEDTPVVKCSKERESKV